MLAIDIDALCREKRWSRARLVHELRSTARQRKVGELPSDDSLKRMIRQWASGSRTLSAFYAELLTAVFGVPFPTGESTRPADHTDGPGDELRTRIMQAATIVDAELVGLLEGQTESFRILDRRLGAARLLPQTHAHVEQITDLLTYTLPGGVRPVLAAAAAEASALSGWQALDLGDTDRAWILHETAKTAARDSGDTAVLAHVTAQQGYALLDLDRPADALALMRHARESAASAVPAVLSAWLWAAEAESLAATGDERGSQVALDTAARLLPADSEGEALPYVFLDDVHLGRWRGHCLARLGSAEAVDDLTSALSGLDPTFTRAAAGLHCDLALAYSQRGEHDAAREQARAAERLATQMASTRQRRRISRLLSSGEDRDAR
jgi:tetratricopeptide (TPR) repeat protein